MTTTTEEYLTLQHRIGELEATLIARDNQVAELQRQLAEAREQIADMTPRPDIYRDPR